MPLHEALLRRIADDTFVSEEQRRAILDEGNLFLLARPGSGKTRTIGIRVAERALRRSAQRMAATSYTNVAVSQINEAIRECGALLDGRHFVGTLHTLLLRYVLYPYAHLAPVSIRQPVRVLQDDSWEGWPSVRYRNENRKRLSVAKLVYRADASFFTTAGRNVGLTNEEAASEEVQQVRDLKQQTRRMGVVSTSDAMYYCQRLLSRHPTVAAAVARRFDEWLVDESQDTNDVQMRCLEILWSTRQLRSLVLIGDLDQSIYGWQGADPVRLRELARRCGLVTRELTQNFRSSQAICNVTHRFCNRAEPDRAAGRTATIDIVPELLVYEERNVAATCDLFARRLTHHGLDDDRAVVLARSNTLCDRINGVRLPTHLPRGIATLASMARRWHVNRNFDAHEIREIEHLLSRFAWGRLPESSDADEARLLRATLRSLVARLPAFNGTVADWIRECRESIGTVLESLTGAPAHRPGQSMRVNRRHERLPAARLTNEVAGAIHARTVHDAKGESHQAVLLVVEQSDGRQADLWSAPLVGQAVDDAAAEEGRIAYVGLTRAEKYCGIAVATTVDEQIIQRFLGAGFRRI